MKYRGKRIHAVLQEDVTGCGIASVARLEGVIYDDTKGTPTRSGLQVTDPRLWSDPAIVRKLLAHYNIEVEPQERPFRSWKTLPPRALFAIKWHRKENQAFWHWVIFGQGPDGPVVLDLKRSLKNHARTDLEKNDPKMVYHDRL